MWLACPRKEGKEEGKEERRVHKVARLSKADISPGENIAYAIQKLIDAYRTILISHTHTNS
jgi:hypothetical protein